MTDWIVGRATIDEIAKLARFLSPHDESTVKQSLADHLKYGHDIWAVYDPHGSHENGPTVVGLSSGNRENEKYVIKVQKISLEHDARCIAKRMARYQIQRTRELSGVSDIEVAIRLKRGVEALIAGYTQAGFDFYTNGSGTLGKLNIREFDAANKTAMQALAHR